MGFFKSFQKRGVTYCFLLLAVISYYEYFSIEESISNTGYTGSRGAYTTTLSLLVVVLLSYFAFYNDFKVLRDDKLVKSYSRFMLFSFIISYLFFVAGLRYYVPSSPFKWISPLFVFWAIYSLTYKIKDIQIISKFALIMMVVLILGYYATYNYFLQAVLTSGVQQQLISSYFSLLLLPLVLCSDSKLVRLIAVAAVAIVLLSSVKRGGVLAFAIALFVYYLITVMTERGGQKKRNIFYFAIGLSLALWVTDYLFQNSDLYIFERLSRVSEDEGSGRIDVFKTVIDMIEKSNFSSIFIGHGYCAVAYDSPLHMGAHNDFLEVYYDYGIFGIVLYVSLHVQLIKYTVRLIKNKSRLAAPMAMSYTLFFILSNVSQMIVYPFFLILFSIVWASIMANRKYEIIERRRARYRHRVILMKNQKNMRKLMIDEIGL